MVTFVRSACNALARIFTYKLTPAQRSNCSHPRFLSDPVFEKTLSASSTRFILVTVFWASGQGADINFDLG